MAYWQDINDFWFGELTNRSSYPAEKAKLWFIKSEATDQLIQKRFAHSVTQALNGVLKEWEAQPHSRLALIILLDQFTRNIYRNSPKAFQGDERAYQLTVDGMEKGMHHQLKFVEQAFFYLPMEHREDLDAQEACLRAFQTMVSEADDSFKPHAENYLDYAKQHAVVIKRFGRYPHRNRVLGRLDTEEEKTYLAQPGSGF